MNKVVKLDSGEPKVVESPGAQPAVRKTAVPNTGELDLRALHDEIAAKFPKTIARLAE